MTGRYGDWFLTVDADGLFSVSRGGESRVSRMGACRMGTGWMWVRMGIGVSRLGVRRMGIGISRLGVRRIGVRRFGVSGVRWTVGRPVGRWTCGLGPCGIGTSGLGPGGIRAWL